MAGSVNFGTFDWWKVGAGWSVVAGALMLGCGLCGPSGGPTGNCESDRRPADDSASVQSGNLQVTLGYTWERRRRLIDTGTTEDDEEPPDAVDATYPDADAYDAGDAARRVRDAMSVDADSGAGPTDSGVDRGDAGGRDVGGDDEPRSGFIPLTDDRKMALHSGFQGGHHIYPAVRVKGVDTKPFESTVKFEIRDGASGEPLTHAACTKRKSDRDEWERTSDGWVYSGIRAVISTDDSELRGETHTLVADVQLEDERTVVEQPVEFE